MALENFKKRKASKEGSALVKEIDAVLESSMDKQLSAEKSTPVTTDDIARKMLKQLRERRKALKMSIGEVSYDARVTVPTITSMELKNGCTLTNFMKVATVLGMQSVSVDGTITWK